MGLTVSKVVVESIKGISYAELSLSGRALTVLRGMNGSGKSSLLDAISLVFSGGSDPSLIRQGAKSGKVMIELSDGTVIKKAQSQKGSQLVVTTADGETVKAPQAYLQELAASFAFSPLAFLSAPKKDRAAFAAKHANLSFPAKELHGLKFGKLDVGGPVRDLVGPDATLTLDDFDKLRDRIYQLRKARNAESSELEKTVNNLRKSLPDEAQPGNGTAAKLPALQKELAALDESERRDLTAIGIEVEQARASTRDDYDLKAKALRQAFDEDMKAAAAVRDAGLEAIQKAEGEATSEVAAGNTAERTRLQQAIAEAQAGLKRAGEVAALSEHLESQQTRLAEKATEAEALDQALRAMDELKKSKLDNLPIPGLTIVDGEIFVDKIPFDQLNMARKFVVAVQIGSLGLGDLPLILTDTAETLDEKEFASFCQAVEESGMQVIVARVSEGPLSSEPQGALKL